MKLTNDYCKDIKKALTAADKYNKSLDSQITALAGALRTMDLCHRTIDQLEEITIASGHRGTGPLVAHPVFKILKDAQESVTKQMKALGLTTAELVGQDDNDPLVDLTRKVQNAGKGKTKKS